MSKIITVQDGDLTFDPLTGNIIAESPIQINDATGVDNAIFSHDGTDFATTFTTTEDWNIEDLTGDVWIKDGIGLKIGDSGNTDFGILSHDGTDFNTVFTNTTDWNISGITAIQAGAVDTDFDAITATSYGGITESDLLDKSATESITGRWNVSRNPDSTSASFVVGGPTSVSLGIDEEDQTSSNGLWEFFAQGGAFRLRTVSDDRLTAVNIFEVERTGITVDSFFISVPLLTLTVQIKNGTHIQEFAVSTTNADLTDIANIVVPVDGVVTATIRGHGHEVATGDSISTIIHVTAKNDGGTTSLVGTASVAHAAEDAGAAAWGFTVTADDTSDTLDFEVTGEAAHNIDWRVSVEWTSDQ